ncbi:hypothetical protein FRC08_002087 [Ceratobasidium sp. 394]|nr:hypothetical protein FRC08_002087 [Ceratobasidium sp. 394]KAG9097155.1 hypothetical protein FS749_006953 [Ceratobasidium sp. UAMH 11750]
MGQSEKAEDSQFNNILLTTPLPISADLQVGSQNTSSQGGASAPLSASDITPAAVSATQPTRKQNATAPASNLADSHSARRKDAHARLANVLLQMLDAAAQPPLTYVAPPPPTTHLRYAVIDIWYHIAPTDTPSLPADFDWNQQIAEDVQYQDSRPFRSCKRPSKCEFLRCIPCLAIGSWHIWINKEGNTRAIRDHMVKHHPEEQNAKCKEHGCTHAPTSQDEEFDGPPPPFSQDGLIERSGPLSRFRY